jgi:DNA-binding NtrC family response regulator
MGFMPEQKSILIIDDEAQLRRSLSLILIKVMHPSLPVIILTAHGEQAAASEALKLGARAYLLKPIDPEDILARVEESIQ